MYASTELKSQKQSEILTTNTMRFNLILSLHNIPISGGNHPCYTSEEVNSQKTIQTAPQIAISINLNNPNITNIQWDHMLNKYVVVRYNEITSVSPNRNITNIPMSSDINLFWRWQAQSEYHKYSPESPNLFRITFR